MSLKDLDTPESHKLAPERMRHLLAGETLTFDVEHYHKDGHTFSLEALVGLVSSGGKSFLLNFQRDITERKRYAEELRKNRIRLERAESVAALGNWELDLISQKVHASAGAAAIYGLQGTEWSLEQVRSLSKPEDWPSREMVLTNLTRVNPERKVGVSIQGGLSVWADRHLLQTVLENLLGNAWKYTSKNQAPSIEVAETVSSSGEKVFFVRDNGAGFDMAHADKLFSAFQRLHSTSEFEGTGIGLSIVKRIIHRHGGRIWAESEPEKGATFFFTLPDRSRA